MVKESGAIGAAAMEGECAGVQVHAKVGSRGRRDEEHNGDVVP